MGATAFNRARRLKAQKALEAKKETPKAEEVEAEQEKPKAKSKGK